MANVGSDKVWRDIYMRIRQAKDAHVKVGVLAEDKGGDEHEGGITMVELAIIHELGAPGIPARSFIQKTFIDKESQTREMITKLAKKVVEKKMTIREALDALGTWAATEIKKTVTTGPPLEPPLKYREGRPLFDTGALINSVTHKVVG